MSDAFFRALARRASRRYKPAGRYARHFAYGKLTRDPVFRHLLQSGSIASCSRILDLGCGQGLLAALVAAAHEGDGGPPWPAEWAPAPAPRQMRGIDLLERDIERARIAAPPEASFECGDIRALPFGEADAVLLLDVLHYLDSAAQDDILDRVRRALPPGGVLLLRVADATGSLRSRITLAADRLAMALRGFRPGPFHCRPVQAWQRRLAQGGFRVEARDMSAGTPFANVLLVALAA